MKRRPIPEGLQGEVGRVFEYYTFSKVFRFTPEQVDDMDEELKELYLFILDLTNKEDKGG